jgi:DNA invertase Pin-like site-specific DNA recombinase
MSAMAEMERGMISERQKDVHEDRRQNGKVWGVDLGPLPLVKDDIRDRIVLEREAGLSFQEIANKLNFESVPTATGGSKWYKSTVRHLYLRKLSK